MNQFFWRPHGPAKTRHFQRTNLADPEASLVLVPAFIMEPPALSLLTPLHREPDLGPGCAGVHLADGFTLLEAETPPQKKRSAHSKYLSNIRPLSICPTILFTTGLARMFCACAASISCPIPTCHPGPSPNSCYRHPR